MAALLVIFDIKDIKVGKSTNEWGLCLKLMKNPNKLVKDMTNYEFTTLEKKVLMKVKKYVNTIGGLQALNREHVATKSAACGEIATWIQNWMEAAEANIQASGLAA